MCFFGGSPSPVIMPAMQAVQAPTPPPEPQAAKQPDQANLRSQPAAGPRGPGPASSTMLTGVGGIDPRLLSIGKNTLLGS